MSIQNINAIDRIPVEVLENGAIRYAEYDSNGNFIEYKYLKRADEPIEAGTNINKTLFDKIDNNVNEEIGERSRVDRYNIPAVTQYIDETEEELVAEDIIPKFWENDNTYQCHSGDIVLSTSQINVQSGTIDKMCDNNTSTYFYIYSNTSNSNFAKIDFARQVKITKMKLFVQISSYVSSIKVQGSNDDDTWEDLYTSNSSLGSLTEVTLTTVGYYRYYRILSTMSRVGYATLYYEWQVSEYYRYKTKNLLTLSNNIDNYTNNQILLIDVPKTDISRITDLIPKTNYIATTNNLFTSGDFILESSEYYSSYYIYNACDGDAINTYWYTNNNTSDKWAKLDFGMKRKITKMKIKGTTFIESYFECKIQGSNNSTTWDDLYTFNEDCSATLTEVELTNTDYYRYYRFYWDWSGSNSRIMVYEIAVSEWTDELFDPTKETFININSLGRKQIIGELSVNKKFSLIYNGENFNSEILYFDFVHIERALINLPLGTLYEIDNLNNMDCDKIEIHISGRFYTSSYIQLMAETSYGKEDPFVLGSDNLLLTFNNSSGYETISTLANKPDSSSTSPMEVIIEYTKNKSINISVANYASRTYVYKDYLGMFGKEYSESDYINLKKIAINATAGSNSARGTVEIYKYYTKEVE